MKKRNRKKTILQKGFLLTELIVAMTVLAMILAGTAASLHSFKQFSQCQWLRQQCIAAAQAQLDSLATKQQPLSGADLKRLWPRVTLTTQFSEGRGQWQGLEHLEVTAQGRSGRHVATVRLSRYVSPIAERPQGTALAQLE